MSAVVDVLESVIMEIVEMKIITMMMAILLLVDLDPCNKVLVF
jgi:hypothetical protein